MQCLRFSPQNVRIFDLNYFWIDRKRLKMVIRTYYCPKCRKIIDVMKCKLGIINTCPHCGVILSGLKEARINELTNFMQTLFLLTLFFIVMTIFFPPIIFVAIITGAGTYIINKKRKATQSIDMRTQAVKERDSEVPEFGIGRDFTQTSRSIRTNNPSPIAIEDKQGVSVSRTLGDVKSKNKTVAILLALFLCFWTWCYSYKKDAWKFWLNLSLSIISMGFWLPVAWIWAIIDAARRPKEFYININKSMIAKHG
jgi:ribosomal protein L37AE/L43A